MLTHNMYLNFYRSIFLEDKAQTEARWAMYAQHCFYRKSGPVTSEVKLKLFFGRMKK